MGCFVPCVPLALCFVLLGSVSFSPCPSWAVGLPHWVWDVLRVWAIFVTVFGPLVGTVLSGPFLSLCGACWDMSFPSVLCLFFESFPIGLVLFLFSFFPYTFLSLWHGGMRGWILRFFSGLFGFPWSLSWKACRPGFLLSLPIWMEATL